MLIPLLTIEEVLKAGYSRDAAIQIVKRENERRLKMQDKENDGHVFTGHPSEYDNRDSGEQKQESSEDKNRENENSSDQS